MIMNLLKFIKELKLPHYLLILYIIIFTILGINPYGREIWLAENIPIMLIVLGLVLTYKKFQFSNTAYILMSILIFMHTVGGHYTFARVPDFGLWNALGFERNMYDRVAHFSVGFYAFACAELLSKKKLVNSNWILYLFPLFFIISVAGFYELFEWQFAIMGDPTAGLEVLGSQGDIWDAQKDILADTFGAVFSLGIFAFLNRGKKNKK